jgi:hypothetical protein
MMDLQDVMAVADAIRQQELQDQEEAPQRRIGSTSANDHDDRSSSSSNIRRDSTVNDDTENDPLRPMRTFFNAPGVAPGLATGALCIGLLLPVRQQILRLGRRRMLGDLPDLIVTPIMVLVACQAGLRVASLTGARAYLERVPLMDHDALTKLCATPVMQRLHTKATDNERDDVVDESHPQSQTPTSMWNPEFHALQALRKAIAACKEKRID